MKPFSKLRTPASLSIAVFYVCLCCAFAASGQEAVVDNQPSLRSYPKMLSLISKKTRKKQEGIYLLEVQWIDTTFQLERKYTNFIEGVAIPKKDNAHYAIYREEPWDGEGYVLPHANCHNFGLAQAFRYEGMDASTLFDPTTYLDPSMLEVLLLTSFEKQGTLDATSMRDLKQPIAQGTLLVFRDSTGIALHTAFQGSEGLLSKNGRYEPRIYHRLEYLKRVYYNALTIDLYRLDAERVKAFLEEQPLQAMFSK